MKYVSLLSVPITPPSVSPLHAGLLMAMLSCLLLSHPASAKVYKWTDNNGQVHYTEHPSATQSNEVIKPKTGHSDPVEYKTNSAESQSSINSVPQTTRPRKDPEICTEARKQQTTLKTSTRVQVKDEKGQYRYLTPDELVSRMEAANKAIEVNCNQ